MSKSRKAPSSPPSKWGMSDGAVKVALLYLRWYKSDCLFAHYTRRFMRLFFTAIFMISLAATFPVRDAYAAGRNSTYIPETKAVLLMDEEELALRQWALDAISKILSFGPDNRMEWMAYYKNLQTEYACRKALWIMDKFEISEAMDRGETVVTSIDPRFPLKHTLERIGVDPIHENIVEKGDYIKGTRMWDVYVPVSIQFSKDLKKRRYKFYACVRVIALSDKIGDYAITSWFPYSGRNTMKPAKNKSFHESYYDECGEIDFVDTEYLKAGDE